VSDVLDVDKLRRDLLEELDEVLALEPGTVIECKESVLHSKVCLCRGERKLTREQKVASLERDLEAFCGWRN
jgi:hypothetical protein